jgi:hypothetical protein
MPFTTTLSSRLQNVLLKYIGVHLKSRIEMQLGCPALHYHGVDKGCNNS